MVLSRGENMETRITKLFGIKYPIILPGMSWISTPELVAAVCNAGGIGWLATGPLSAEQTREAIKKIRSLTKKPFGCGCTLLMPGARENAEVMLEEKVPVINVSLGKCDWIAERAHKYGGKVIATVTTVKHAMAAEAQGADAVQVTGNEAAAHGSQVTTMVLVPAIARAVKIPVVGIGGAADGAGMMAILALGAEGVGMGTRLALTKESPVHQTTKDAHVKAGIDDTIYSNRFDGLYCRVLDTPAAKKSIRQGMSLPRAGLASWKIAKAMNLPWIKLAIGTMLQGPKLMMQLAHFATAFEKIQDATEFGDLKKGVALIGQVQGLIHDIPTVKQVIDTTIAEAKEIEKRLAKSVK
ncbi:MAG TPA: nitronate monooxygenase [Spirochaetota bacterium]|nr:nitronate monooxygenase [Spirochaetota bacterium]HOS38934.1 nitronate monooxygenase [Spirochaetota bacterium]HPU87664.1 nitronate monooxygenase [Spirochaetota bacterium]